MNENLAEFLAREDDHYRSRSAAAPPGGETAAEPDENLLALLADGLISAAQREELLKQAAANPQVRKRVAAIVAEWDETVEIAGGAPAAGWEEPPGAADDAGGAGGRIFKLRRAAAYALAASLFFAAGTWLYLASRTGPANNYGINLAAFLSGDAALTELGIDLRQRTTRAETAPAISEQDYAAALEKLDPALRKNPPPADALALATRAALSANRFEDAAGFAERWAAAAPRDAAAHNAYGLALYRLKRFEEALGAFERAIALAPNDADFHLNAALAADATDDMAQAPVARQHLTRFLELAPNDPRREEAARWRQRLDKQP